MSLLSSTPRPGLLWEPAHATGHPFVFSTAATIISAGDILTWDQANVSTRTGNDLGAVTDEVDLDGIHALNFWTPTIALELSAMFEQVVVVALESKAIPALASFATNEPFPRLHVLCAGMAEVLCNGAVLEGQLLNLSRTDGRTLDPITAPGATISVPTVARALEDSPAGGGLTMCQFDGFYGFGHTMESYV